MILNSLYFCPILSGSKRSAESPTWLITLTLYLIMCQRCTCKILSDSVNGRVVLYGQAAADQTHNIVLMFNNITQWLCYDDFLALEWNVRSIDVRAFFEIHPGEDRIHLSTPSPCLNFSFRAGEMHELKQLLGKAVARLHWHEALKKSEN